MILTPIRGKLPIQLASLVTALLTLTSCSTTGDSGELSRVQSAAAAYSAELSALNNPQDATHDRDRLAASAAILSGQPAYIDQSCESTFVTAYQAYISSLGNSAAVQEQSYSDMISAVKPCSSVTAPPAVGAPIPAKVGLRPAAPAAPIIPQKDADVAAALQKYFEGIQAIANATSANDITAAASSIETSAGSLADSLKAPALVKPSLSLINKLVGLALQEMQYRALREVVVKMDPFLSAAAPILGADMRLTQGKNLQYAASNASASAALVNNALVALKTQPEARLATYNLLVASLDDANSVYLSLGADDPTKIIRNLVSAHHDLATALAKNKHQQASILSAASTIAQGGKAISDAASKGATK